MLANMVVLAEVIDDIPFCCYNYFSEIGARAHGQFLDKRRNTMNETTLRTAAMGAATALALAAAPPAASADDYQYMISGDPIAAASAGTAYGDSSGTSLAVGAFGGTSAADELDARRRVSGDSTGTALDSTKLKAMVIVLR